MRILNNATYRVHKFLVKNTLNLFNFSYRFRRSCLRHCATNGKVAGLIPDGVIGIFH